MPGDAPWPSLLRDRDAARYLGISTRLLWRMVATGDAPAPIRLPGRITRWRRADLDAAIARWAMESEPVGVSQ